MLNRTPDADPKRDARRRRYCRRQASRKGDARVFELSWLKPDRYSYTVACDLPIQGACADAAMLALASIDAALVEEGIDGGPVAWLHDDIVPEVSAHQADPRGRAPHQGNDGCLCRNLSRGAAARSRQGPHRGGLGRGEGVIQ